MEMDDFGAEKIISFLNVTELGLCRGTVGTMEAISHVNRHVGSSQLFKRLAIQNQEECSFILEKRINHSGYILRIMSGKAHEKQDLKLSPPSNRHQLPKQVLCTSELHTVL